jgi:hypothetical protein
MCPTLPPIQAPLPQLLQAQHWQATHWQVPQEQQLQAADWSGGSTFSTWPVGTVAFWIESSEMFMRIS